MSNYTKITNFAGKDTLATGNPSKIVSGAEIGAEFDAIVTAVASKVNAANGALTGTTTAETINASTKLKSTWLEVGQRASSPTVTANTGAVYVKLVSGIPELFFADPTNGEVQLTSGGSINIDAPTISYSVANLTAAGAVDAPVYKSDTVTAAISSGTLTLDLSAGSNFKVTMDQNITAIVLTGLTDAVSQSAIIEFNNIGETYTFTTDDITHSGGTFTPYKAAGGTLALPAGAITLYGFTLVGSNIHIIPLEMVAV